MQVTCYAGVDIGTTTITAVVVDAESGLIRGVATVPNATETTSAEMRKEGRSEWDGGRMVQLAAEALGEAVAGVAAVAGIGVTGQQHGMLLVGADGVPIGPFVGWQDRRGLGAGDSGTGTYVDRMRQAVVQVGARGCRPTAGYLGTTLYWLKTNEQLSGRGFTACFMPDYAAACLAGERPVTDPTDAAGSGLYDIYEGRWHTELIESLGLSVDWLPDVRPSASPVGGLSGLLAERVGLPAGVPVFAACGDNQASFAGSVSDYSGTLLINIGTGGQLSVHMPQADSTESLEARPFLDGAFLLVGAGLVGGRSYAWLRDLFREIGRAFFGGTGDEDLYEAMNALAEATPKGADGLRCEPLFTGTRREPERRGLWEGAGTYNFSPGHMARALLGGVATQFRDYYGEMEACGAGGRRRLVGAGNGIRKNRLLRDILQEALGMPMAIPAHTEEAAYGAALLAGVGDAYFSSFEDAGKVIRYD